MTRRTGFTLIELIVALAIFAVLAAVAYGGLRSVLDQQAFTEERAERLERLQLSYRMLSRDLEQLEDRGIRDEFGDRQPALVAETGLEGTLRFTHGGWRNPAGRPRSTLQRVAYALEDGRLLRRHWRVLDRAQDSAPREQVLLEGVDRWQMRFLGADNEWHERWPPDPLTAVPPPDAPAAVSLPRAVEVELELPPWGRLRWLFQVPV